jgi:hypothetical protein
MSMIIAHEWYREFQKNRDLATRDFAADALEAEAADEIIYE